MSIIWGGDWTDFNHFTQQLKPNPRSLEWDKHGKLSTTHTHRRLKKIHVFVDESGDRNFAANRQSDHFTMTAVCIPEESLLDMRFTVEGLRGVIKRNGVLHWKDHFRNRPKELWKRELAAEKISAMTYLKVVHVILDKPSLYANAHMRKDQTMAYNYVAMLLMERVSQVAKAWEGGERVALTRFGVVGGVDHGLTKSYLEDKALGPDPYGIPWENILWPVSWKQQADYEGLQLADIYSGMFDAAVRLNLGDYLCRCGYQVHRSDRGQVTGYGLKLHPKESKVQLYQAAWWRTFMDSKRP